MIPHGYSLCTSNKIPRDRRPLVDPGRTEACITTAPAQDTVDIGMRRSAAGGYGTLKRRVAFGVDPTLARLSRLGES